MRMTPQQFETRCTHNMVHFVLCEQQRRNPFWSQSATLSLMGKGPRFIPKARSLSTTEVLGACARLNYRMVRAFERFVKRNDHNCRDVIRREAGIQSWTPKQCSLTTEYCRTYVKRFFKCADENGTWRGNQFLSPFFDHLSAYVPWSEISLHQQPTPERLLQPDIDGPISQRPSNLSSQGCKRSMSVTILLIRIMAQWFTQKNCSRSNACCIWRMVREHIAK